MDIRCLHLGCRDFHPYTAKPTIPPDYMPGLFSCRKTNSSFRLCRLCAWPFLRWLGWLAVAGTSTFIPQTPQVLQVLCLAFFLPPCISGVGGLPHAAHPGDRRGYVVGVQGG